MLFLVRTPADLLTTVHLTPVLSVIRPHVRMPTPPTALAMTQPYVSPDPCMACPVTAAVRS